MIQIIYSSMKELVMDYSGIILFHVLTYYELKFIIIFKFIKFTNVWRKQVNKNMFVKKVSLNLGAHFENGVYLLTFPILKIT